MPTTFADPLTDTDNTLLHNHQAPGGPFWIYNTSVSTAGRYAQIVSNHVVTMGATSSDIVAYLSPWAPEGPDYDVSGEAQIASASTNAYVAVIGRATGTNTHYQLRYAPNTSGGVWQLHKVVAGVTTLLGSASIAATGYVTDGLFHPFILRMRGNQISALVDGATVIGPITDSAITAAGSAGVKFYGNAGSSTPSVMRNFGAADAVGVPINTLAPRITVTIPSAASVLVRTDITPYTNDTLSCTTGSWSGRPTSYAYQWQRGGVAITGATASTYQLVTADEGQAITCQVTATNASGASTPAVSQSLGALAQPVALPTVLSAPAITGLRETASTLTCSSGTWTGAPTFVFQWYRDGQSIGGNSATYVLGAPDQGKQILCSVKATNAGGFNTAYARA